MRRFSFMDSKLLSKSQKVHLTIVDLQIYLFFDLFLDSRQGSITKIYASSNQISSPPLITTFISSMNK